MNINQNGKTKIHPIIIPNINRREKTIKSALFIRNGGFQITGVAQTKPKEFLENAFVSMLVVIAGIIYIIVIYEFMDVPVPVLTRRAIILETLLTSSRDGAFIKSITIIAGIKPIPMTR